MSDSIRLSNAHGINPAIPKCYLCLEDKNEVILAGKMRPLKDEDGYVYNSDPQAPQGAVWDMEPCDKCNTWREKGVILISTREGEQGNNPYRTGGWVVVSKDFVMRAISDQAYAETVCRTGCCFVPDSTWDILGLLRTPNE